MDSGSVTCLSTVMILFSAWMAYLARRTVEKQMRANIDRKQAAEKQRDAMLVALKWVHQVHQAVYFGEVSAQRVLPENLDDSGWKDVVCRLEALGSCPPESGLLPESLRSMVGSIEPELAEIKSCVARHRESLALIPYGSPSGPMLSKAELSAARRALAGDLEEKSRKLNLFMETLEKHFDAAFFAPLDVKLHRGRNDPPIVSRASSVLKQHDSN